jgi:hypothetical protein
MSWIDLLPNLPNHMWLDIGGPREIQKNGQTSKSFASLTHARSIRSNKDSPGIDRHYGEIRGIQYNTGGNVRSAVPQKDRFVEVLC